MLNRAYSIVDLKSIDDEQRVIRGMASTPAVDRVGDVVDPLGARAAADIPLFLYHDSNQTVGRTRLGKATKDGIPFEASIPHVKEPGRLKDRVDEAWQMLKYRLITGVSIGFKPKADGVERMKDGGLRFKDYEVLELSLVPVPANAEATITSIKSLDAASLASLGDRARGVVRLDPAARPTPPGVSGQANPPETLRGTPQMNIAEQIAAFETKKKAAQTKAEAIVVKTTEEGRTRDDAEKEEYASAVAEVKAIDEHLEMLKGHEQIMVSKATPVTVTAGTTPADRGVEIPGHVISVNRNVDKGIAFTRYALALMRAKGNVMQAEQIAKQWRDSTPEVEILLKAAVAAGTTSDSVWAGPLVYAQNMTSEFIEFLRPQTILGRLPNVRRVPFNIRIPRQTAGISGAFVGEGLPIPVQKPGFDSITMTWAKASTIVALTAELVQNSNPSAEALVRQDLADGISAFLDKRFIDPSYGGVANVSPASVSNGVTSRQASGITLAAIDADVGFVMAAFATAELGLSDGIWVMPPATAITLSLMRNSQGYQAFPTLTMNGGTWYGLPVITSNNVVAAGSPGEQQIFLIAQREILLSDDGQMTIDMSSEASVQMDSAPSTGAQSLVSFWQDGLVGLKVNRWINWAKRRSAAVQYIEQAQRYAS